MRKFNLILNADGVFTNGRVEVCACILREYFALSRVKEVTIVLSKTERPNSYFIRVMSLRRVIITCSKGEKDNVLLYFSAWLSIRAFSKKGCWVSVEA